MKRVYVVFEDCSDTWSTPGDYDYDEHNLFLESKLPWTGSVLTGQSFFSRKKHVI